MSFNAVVRFVSGPSQRHRLSRLHVGEALTMVTAEDSEVGNGRVFHTSEIRSVEIDVNGPPTTEVLERLPERWSVTNYVNQEGKFWLLVDENNDYVEVASSLEELLESIPDE